MSKRGFIFFLLMIALLNVVITWQNCHLNKFVKSENPAPTCTNNVSCELPR